MTDERHLLIPKIENGIVIDHLPAGLGAEILQIIRDHRELADATIALALNLPSARLGRKDMIKLWSPDIPEHVVAHVSLVAPGATIKRVRDFQVEKKYTMSLPARLDNMVRCLAPNCMTNVDRGVPTRFHLVDEARRLFRCAYCERVFPLAQLERIRLSAAPSVPWSAE